MSQVWEDSMVVKEHMPETSENPKTVSVEKAREISWRIDVRLVTGVKKYEKRLLERLERAGCDAKPHVSHDSQVVIIDELTKEIASEVMEWTMDFWAVDRVEARRNFLVDRKKS